MQFLRPFLDALLIVLDVLQWLIFVWVILSWILFFVRQSQFRWRHRRAYHILEQLDDIFTRMTYPFLRPFLGQCRFPDCSHVHEPDCAVRHAVEAGAIDRDRYDSYLRILDGDER